MSANDAFLVDIRGFAADANRSVEDTARAIVMNLFESVIESTPVGSPSIWKDQKAAAKAVADGYTGGRARGNWQLTDDAPAATSIEFATGKQGLAAAEKTKSDMANIQPGGKHYLANNLPYIGMLEYGSHSSQAVDGMVRKNMLRILFTSRDLIREYAL